jgi:hypothetical protein
VSDDEHDVALPDARSASPAAAASAALGLRERERLVSADEPRRSIPRRRARQQLRMVRITTAQSKSMAASAAVIVVHVAGSFDGFGAPPLHRTSNRSDARRRQSADHRRPSVGQS